MQYVIMYALASYFTIHGDHFLQLSHQYYIMEQRLRKKLTSLPITQNKYFSETIDRNVKDYNNTNNKKEYHYQSSQNKNQLYIVAWHFLQNTHCSKNGKKYIHTIISKNQCL